MPSPNTMMCNVLFSSRSEHTISNIRDTTSSSCAFLEAFDISHNLRGLALVVYCFHIKGDAFDIGQSGGSAVHTQLYRSLLLGVYRACLLRLHSDSDIEVIMFEL